MRAAMIALSGLALFICIAGAPDTRQPKYTVLPGITDHNLTVFPVLADASADTSRFLTLDEGIRSGEVTVAEIGQNTGLVRPHPADRGVWQERPFQTPLPQTARVNQLALLNHSDRPLILLAGEIVTGGKQDRVVGKDRIVPPHSEPVALDVFCVEPHRWVGASLEFGGTGPAIAQPAVREKAMAAQNQQEVWDEVAKSRAAFVTGLPAPQASAVESSSSYANALQNRAVKMRVDSIAAPIEQSYEKIFGPLKAKKAVGVVAAVQGEIIWADVFASPALLDRYWPKLIRSYAAEALVWRTRDMNDKGSVSQANAQEFINHLYGGRENIESEPGIYSTTEIQGAGFKVFVLTSLLPSARFQVHLAKMQD